MAIDNSLRKKTILVTGGAGFIGSWMCVRLLGLGARVICVDDLSTGKRENIAPCMQYGHSFIFVRADVNSKKALAVVFSKYRPHYVLHYAAFLGVQRTLENPFKVLADVEGIKNILELSRTHNVAKALFSSSSEVYGELNGTTAIENKTPINSRLPYAAVKVLGEIYFRTYYEEYGLPTVSLRFFNVYGPRQESSSYGFVTAIFMRQALSGKPLTVFGRGVQTRDFVYIKDNIEATLKALLNPKIKGEEINIGTGKETRVIDLAKKIIRLSGKSSKIKFLPPRKKGDMIGRCPDITKMKKLLKYQPQYTLDHGLRETYEKSG